MRKSAIIPAVLGTALPGLAAAAESYPIADYTTAGWGAFVTEAFRSLDLIGFLLLTLLVILLAMALDLVSHLRISKLIPESVLAEVQEEMANGEYERALEVSEKADCLIGQVFAAALAKTDYSFERMQEAMRGEVAIQALIWRQWVGQFRIAAAVGLLLGLMGAAVNVMRFIGDLAGRPNVGLALASSFEMRSLLNNVFAALLFGCAMACLSLVAYTVCSSKLDKVILEAERLGNELLDPFRPLPLPEE